MRFSIRIYSAKVKKNGLVRILKYKFIYWISIIRGFAFGIFNSKPRFPKDLRVGKNISCLVRYLEIGDGVTIGPNCSFSGLGLVRVGNRVVLNRNVHIDSDQYIHIGDGSIIAPDCYFVDSNHVTHPDTPINSKDIISRPICIGENVWLGRGVSVLCGVTIGNNSIIGAGAVVVRDIPPNSTAVGVPARCI